MKKFIFSLVITITISFLYTGLSFAACVEGPPNTFTCNTADPNPDLNGVQQDLNNNNLTVNVVPGAGIDTRTASGGNGLDGIRTADGNDLITLDGADVFAQDDCIDVRGGNNTINITDSEMFAVQNDGINTGSGNNVVHILNSDIRVDTEDAIQLSNGNDMVEIHGSVVGVFPGNNPGDNGVRCGGGNDQVTVSDSLLRGVTEALQLSSGDDTATLGTGTELDGLLTCGDGFDTLIFTMDVPEEAVGFISSQIHQAGLPDGSVTINDLFYEWTDCELLIPQLNGVRVVRPIPTLSEWGLIAMAGILGIAALLVIRRRNVTA